jgi:hypothetical protein
MCRECRLIRRVGTPPRLCTQIVTRTVCIRIATVPREPFGGS